MIMKFNSTIYKKSLVWGSFLVVTINTINAAPIKCPTTFSIDEAKNIAKSTSGIVKDDLVLKAYDQAAFKKNLPSVLSQSKFSPKLLRSLTDKQNNVVCQYNYVGLRNTQYPLDIVIVDKNAWKNQPTVEASNAPSSSRPQHESFKITETEALAYFGFNSRSHPSSHDLMEAHLEKLEQVEKLAKTNPTQADKQLKELQSYWDVLKKLHNLH